MRPPCVAKGDVSLRMRRKEASGGWGLACVCVGGVMRSQQCSWEGKWRSSPGNPEGDVTAPELVITGGNGGVKGHPGVMLVCLRRIDSKDFQNG